MQLNSDTRELAEVKTKAARRTIDLSAELVGELRAHRARMLAEGHPHGFVFCDTVGNPLHGSNVASRSWKPLKARAFGSADGIPAQLDVRFHDLRHTTATLMFAAGVQPLVVSRRLGLSVTV